MKRRRHELAFYRNPVGNRTEVACIEPTRVYHRPLTLGLFSIKGPTSIGFMPPWG